MSALDTSPSADRVFNAPWDAQAFALAVELHQRGAFTWPEWAETLSMVIAEARVRGDPDLGNDYYRHWTMALERIVARKGLLTDAQLAARQHAWVEAARRTPHGRPIELQES